MWSIQPFSVRFGKLDGKGHRRGVRWSFRRIEDRGDDGQESWSGRGHRQVVAAYLGLATFYFGVKEFLAHPNQYYSLILFTFDNRTHAAPHHLRSFVHTPHYQKKPPPPPHHDVLEHIDAAYFRRASVLSRESDPAPEYFPIPQSLQASSVVDPVSGL